MNSQSRVASSRKFMLFITIYLVISLAAFLLPGGGYSFALFLFILGFFYLIIWVLLALICTSSRSVRYYPVLTYFILFIQTIAILFNIPDSGYYGITCNTKNFVQSFFDRSRCSGLWMNYETYMPILYLYMLLVIVFVLNVLWLRFVSPNSR